MKGKRIAIPASTKRCKDAAAAASHTVIDGSTIWKGGYHAPHIGDDAERHRAVERRAHAARAVKTAPATPEEERGGRQHGRQVPLGLATRISAGRCAQIRALSRR